MIKMTLGLVLIPPLYVPAVFEEVSKVNNFFQVLKREQKTGVSAYMATCCICTKMKRSLSFEESASSLLQSNYK